MIDPLLDERPVSAPERDHAKVKRDVHRWARLIHVYASMVALFVILFFGLTGITVNHPEWTFGSDVSTTSLSGDLTVDAVTAEGTVDFLAISEFPRTELGAKGSVDSYDVVNGVASVVYKNPGYAADLFVDLEKNSYEFSVEQQGWIAVMNDLHKGRDAGSGWGWVIDLSGAFLVAVSITGLVMQFFLRKRRRSALISATVGTVLAIGLILWVLS